MRKRSLLVVVILLCTLLSGCSQLRALDLSDGYFTAEATTFDAHGWKEFLTVYINNKKIVTVEFNAKNASGMIKSWDVEYMRAMNAKHGTYPNKYTRAYAADLLNKQNPALVDGISGATHSYTSFQLLAEAAVGQAKTGDKNVVFVELPEVEEEMNEG